jgi:hypothetical protein
MAEPEEDICDDRITDLQALREQIAKSGKPAKSQRMYPMVNSDRK